VAQALHRKANKAEVDEAIAKKVDFDDLLKALSEKADVQHVQRMLDFKDQSKENNGGNFDMDQLLSLLRAH
jgi:hypothetical protein